MLPVLQDKLGSIPTHFHQTELYSNMIIFQIFQQKMDKTLNFEEDPKWEKIAIEMMETLERLERQNAKKNEKNWRSLKKTVQI